VGIEGEVVRGNMVSRFGGRGVRGRDKRSVGKRGGNGGWGV